MNQSHFVLCPRGAGAGSIRLFEVMAEGIAPVLIADNYALPPQVDWDSFLLRIPEREIAHLPRLLEPHLNTARQRGQLARQAFEQAFLPELEFDRIVQLAFDSLGHSGPAEDLLRRGQRRMARNFRRRILLRKTLRQAAKPLLRLLASP